MDSNSAHNKWIIHQGDVIIGLVHPETEEEAEAEQLRLGHVGTLVLRDEFEGSPEEAAILLVHQRGSVKEEIKGHAKKLCVLIRDLTAVGAQPGKTEANINAKVPAKNDIVDTATKEELDAFDPTADW